MPHKLLITFEVDTTGYRGLLKHREIVSGIPATFTFNAENIGDIPFPGGTVVSKVLEGRREGSQVLTDAQKVEVPRIEPTQSIELCTWEIQYPFEDPLMVSLQIQAKDKETIEYHQIKKVRQGTDKWYHFLSCVSRQNLDMIVLLQNILKLSKGS